MAGSCSPMAWTRWAARPSGSQRRRSARSPAGTDVLRRVVEPPRRGCVLVVFGRHLLLQPNRQNRVAVQPADDSAELCGLRPRADHTEKNLTPLAIDTSTLRERVVVLSISVLYRGAAIPLASVRSCRTGVGEGGVYPPLGSRCWRRWHRPCRRRCRVVVLTYRCLYSPALVSPDSSPLGWHPVMRILPDATFTPDQPAPPPGACIWCQDRATLSVGAMVAYKDLPQRLAATLLVFWVSGPGRAVAAADRSGTSQQIGVSWYGSALSPIRWGEGRWWL